MEFVETDLPKFTNITPSNLNQPYKPALICTSKHQLNSEEITNYDTCDKFAEVYQYLTPTKNLRGKNLTVNSSPVTKTWNSPMQMSFDNSYNLDAEKCPKFNIIDDAKIADSEKTFRRMDSGFADKPMQLGRFKSSIDATVCHTSNCNSTVDVTKSLQNSGDSSGWKRFDSGFHDETSSDFVHPATSHDTIKTFSQKYTPIAEYLEDHKELVNFDDFNKFLECGTRAQSSMSFADDMLSLIKFSSTPSKKQCAK